MTHLLPDLLKLGTVLATAAGANSILSAQNIDQIQSYGIGGVSLVFAALFFNLWRNQAKTRDAEHAARIAALNAEIKRLRDKYHD